MRGTALALSWKYKRENEAVHRDRRKIPISFSAPYTLSGRASSASSRQATELYRTESYPTSSLFSRVFLSPQTLRARKPSHSTWIHGCPSPCMSHCCVGTSC